ncbi:MAG: hypothetical protein Q9166_006585 [cf. Caloplaca sp. 2 TL-2023]
MQSAQQSATTPTAPPAETPTGDFVSGSSHDRGGWNPGGKPLPTLPQDTSLSLLDSQSSYENPVPGMASKLDTAEVAIDFVLALEHICMSHLPHPADPPSDEPTNRALLMSTALVARAPRPPQPNSSWTANGTMIKELLNLASAINLQDHAGGGMAPATPTSGVLETG